MPTEGSITQWIEPLRAGDALAAQALWERYYAQLVKLARQKLAGSPRRVADEEDVALSALDSFCRAAQVGRFPDLADRDNVWRLLLGITAKKAVDQMRREKRKRRGGGHVLGESDLDHSNRESGETGMAAIRGDAPSPQFAALLTEEYRRLLDLLNDPDLQAVAVAKMEGYTNKEIAAQRDCSVRTIERQLQLIRKKWENEYEQ